MDETSDDISEDGSPAEEGMQVKRRSRKIYGLVVLLAGLVLVLVVVIVFLLVRQNKLVSENVQLGNSAGRGAVREESGVKVMEGDADIIDSDSNFKGVTKYLTFQLFTGSLEEKTPYAVLGSPPEIEASIADMVEFIGTTGDEENKLGFFVGPLAIDQKDDMENLISETFDLAVKYDVAAGVHLDTDMFWAAEADLWKMKDNVEELGWNGPISTGRNVAWLPRFNLAPVMCVNSLGVETAMTAFMADVASLVKDEVDELKAKGKEHLFAGLIVGWESHLGTDVSGASTGYCALKNAGYSASNPPLDIDKARAEIMADYINVLAKAVVDEGIDQEKIYSHIAFFPEANFQVAKRAGDIKGTYLEMNGFTGANEAFGKYVNPGFSAYPVPNTIEEIWDTLAEYNNPPWAMAEGTNLLPGAGNVGAGFTWDQYLGNVFNHGGTVTNIFAFFSSGDQLQIETRSDDARAAYRKFLGGEQFVDDDGGSVLPAR